MYTFKTKPYDHQLDAFNKSWKSPYHALFMEMGTGKTKVIVDTIGALLKTTKLLTLWFWLRKGFLTIGCSLRFPRICQSGSNVMWFDGNLTLLRNTKKNCLK